MARIVFLWVLGILLIVPYSVYQLIFHAAPDQYAFLIVAPLFWIFGFWGVVGPMLAAARIHRVMTMLETMRDRDQLQRLFETDGKQAIIDLVARENRIPRFLAELLYQRFLARLAKARENGVVTGKGNPQE